MTSAKPSPEKGDSSYSAGASTISYFPQIEMVTTTSTRATAYPTPADLSQELTTKMGKSLGGWPKKRRKHQIQEVVPESAAETIVIPECNVLNDERAGGRETTWAVLWLRRLRPRKKDTVTSAGKGKRDGQQPKLMTLAEQLHGMQEPPLSLSQSKVVPTYLRTNM